MGDIHPTAIIEPGASLGSDVRVGAYALIGANVRLDDGVVVNNHAVVEGYTHLGRGCRVYPFAAVGTTPQDLKYAGEKTELVVGEETIIREHATLHPGTAGGDGVTRVGHKCLLMVGAHVAHDCRVGDGVVMANNATLGGHVVVEERAILGGLVAVHQFSRIGSGAMIGGMSGVEGDVIPFGMAIGNRARLNGLNVVGLKRLGISKDELKRIRGAYHLLFDGEHGTFETRVAEVENEYGDLDPVRRIVAFIRAGSNRPLCRPPRKYGG